MADSTSRASKVNVVVEVDGNPVGFLDLDVERLWSVIDHRKRDGEMVEWMDREKFDSILRAAVVKRLVSRLKQNLYQLLGSEIVKAQLDVESVMLRAENAAQSFGKTTADIEKLATESQRSVSDFYTFFCDHLVDEREGVDLKKEWKAAAKK
jgi:hypothetical protein